MMGKSLYILNLCALLTLVDGQVVNTKIVLAQELSEKILTEESFSENEISFLRELDRPAITVEEWMSQISEPIQITEIQVQVTTTGIDIVLVTETGIFAPIQTETTGDTLIAEITNAVLAFPGGEYKRFNPIEGIASIEAQTLDEQTVQLRITGTDASPIAEINAQGQTLQVRVTVEESIEVLATREQQNPYVAPNATTGTRTDTPLRDVPQSIQVIPRQVIEDQGVLRLNDALRNVSGVVLGENEPRGQRFNIRGFDSSSVLRDGFRLTNGGGGNIGFTELINIEQIEVLKGPAAILFGSVEPGGVVNLVSERPLSEPFSEFGLRLGNRNLVEPSVDVTGPISDDGRVLFRLNALYRREDYYRDFANPLERIFIAPVISWQISDNTDITVELEYRNDERPSDFGLVAIGDEVADVPFDRALESRDLVSTAEFLRTGYRFEHRFSDNWKVRNAFYYTSYDTNIFINLAGNLGLPAFNEATGDIISLPATLNQPSDTFEMQTNVVGKFSTGSIQHTLLAGVDLYRREDLGSQIRGQIAPPILNNFNIFNPDYSGFVFPNFATTPLLLDTVTTTDNLGLYVQDQIDLLDNLILLAGMRYDAVSTENSGFNIITGTTETKNDDSAVSPRIGIVYQPIEEISLYGSYSRSFSPNTATTFSGDILDPEEGEQFEVGARAELLDGNLVVSLALFEIEKENVAVPDPVNVGFSIAAGTQRTRGIEFDLIGEIVPGWNLIANYAYTDSEVVESTDGNEGNDLFGVPDHSFNLWTTYEIQNGSLEGLLFGAGFNFVDERFGGLDNSFTVDSYFVTNAVISYEQDNWQASLNFRNLFDVDYIESVANGRNRSIFPGEGFTVIGSISVTF